MCVCGGVRSKVSAAENQSLNDRAQNSHSLEPWQRAWAPYRELGEQVTPRLAGRGLARGRELPIIAVELLVGRAQPMALLSTPGPMWVVGF